MFYPEFEYNMLSGNFVENDFFWVTSWYRNLPLTQPSRHVPPALVQVKGNHEIPTNKDALFLGYHFRPCGKYDRLLSKVILPYEGVMNVRPCGDVGSLEIFLTEAAAKRAYVKAAADVKADIALVYDGWDAHFAAKLAEVDARISKIT